MPVCYQLVGVPGSGKSTWVQNQTWASDCVIVSTDNLVEQYAQSQGKTYNEVFKSYMPIAVKLMAEQVVAAREQGQDIIWDQTSTSIASRRRKFNMLPDYKHIAVIFNTPESEELTRRLNSRPGKNIPIKVIEQMAFDLEMEPPTVDEGFSEIWRT